MMWNMKDDENLGEGNVCEEVNLHEEMVEECNQNNMENMSLRLQSLAQRLEWLQESVSEDADRGSGSLRRSTPPRMAVWREAQGGQAERKSIWVVDLLRQMPHVPDEGEGPRRKEAHGHVVRIAMEDFERCGLQRQGGGRQIDGGEGKNGPGWNHPNDCSQHDLEAVPEEDREVRPQDNPDLTQYERFMSSSASPSPTTRPTEEEVQQHMEQAQQLMTYNQNLTFQNQTLAQENKVWRSRTNQEGEGKI